MQLADLGLFQAVAEARFSPAYGLWDRAGRLWSSLKTALPDLRMLNAELNQTVFRLGNNCEFAARLENASISAFKPPRTLTQFSEHADQFFRVLCDVLEIYEYKRVGFRLIFARQFPTIQEASAALLTSKVLRWPEGKHFNHGGDPIRPEWALRWENGGSGIHIRLRVDERKYEFEPPLVWEGPPPEKKELVTLTYDVDSYTLSAVLVTQMSFVDWIRQCVHLVNRDSDAFLGGM